MRILLVEHDPSSGLPLAALLASHGHDVVRAPSIERAIVQYERAPFSLVVVDLGQVDQDGIAFCRRIRDMNVAGYVHVMVLAAPGQPHAAVDMEAAGVQDLLLKPISDETLRAHLSVAVAFICLYQNLDVLQGVVQICARCKKVQRQQGVWQDMEANPTRQSYVQFSRTICPACQGLALSEPILALQRAQQNTDPS